MNDNKTEIRNPIIASRGAPSDNPTAPEEIEIEMEMEMEMESFWELGSVKTLGVPLP